MRDLVQSPQHERRWSIAAALIALVVFVGGALPALAAGPIQDDANMLSATARTSAESKSAQILRDTGKTITVKSVPNLGGKDISATADQFFQQQKLNGVLLYLARDDKKFKITIGTDTRQAISTTEEGAIRDQMTQRFAANDFDGGVLNAMDRIGTDLRAAAPARTGQTQPAPAAKKSSSGFPILLIVLLVVAVVAVVLIVLTRRNRNAISGGGNYGAQGGYPQQGGYGPGYGPGYGQQGGGGPGIGGSIIGGAAAGIGGAIVGNAIYDHFRDHDDNSTNDNYNRDNSSVGDYGARGDDQGNVSDSGQDVGSWGGDSGGGDAGAGDWGDSSSGDPGSN